MFAFVDKYMLVLILVSRNCYATANVMTILLLAKWLKVATPLTALMFADFFIKVRTNCFPRKRKKIEIYCKKVENR